MAIRKIGAVTGQVTEVEQAGQEGITVTGSLAVPEWEQASAWTGPDEDSLAAENKAADQE